MAAYARSASTDWPASSTGTYAPRLTRSSLQQVRAAPSRPGRRPRSVPWPVLMAADGAAGLVAATMVAGLEVSVGALLAGLWALTLVTSRGPARGPVRVGPIRPVARAALVLAFLTTLVGGLGGTVVEPTSVVAFLAVAAPLAAVEAAGVTWLCRVEPTRVVVVGDRSGVDQMVAELQTAPTSYEVVGACVTGTSRPSDLQVPVIDGLAHVPAWVVNARADAVVAVPGPQLDPVGMRRLGWALDGLRTDLLVATGVRDLGATRTTLAHDGGLALIHVRHARLHGASRHVKEAWERSAAALALLVLAPLLVTLVLVVRLESEGPALFRQTRVGRHGRPFTMLKLRSMTADAERRRSDLVALAGTDEDDVLFKLSDDPRMTRVGRFLRKYSLDELPQLVNVVRGEMALVGPRPALAEEVAKYGLDARRRLAVTPGLTGLWQVSGRSDLSWDESVRLDLRYVENWSLGLDLQILLRTLPAVLGHRGAY